MKIEEGRILNDYIQPNKKQYCIPVFQRDYAWTEEQCRKLFEDIIMAYEKDIPHFCGAFVYAPLTTKNHIDYYIIIDGQQRYTTLYILIKALADSATDDADKAALEKYLFNEDPFNRYGLDEKSKLKLKPVKTDNIQLMLLMSGKTDEMDKSQSGIIYHNYILFKDLIAKYLAEDENHSVMMIHDGIDNLICADIRLEKQDNAQEIFERINSTGIKLGLADLIRNYVLMTDNEQERLYEDYWLKTQEMLPRNELESFFLEYLNFKLDGFVKESDAYETFKKLFVSGKYTNESSLQEILHYAKQYKIFLCGDDSLGDEINNELGGLRQLKQTTVYIFLFSVFDDFENNVINKATLEKVLRLLLRYSIRRLVCEIGSNSLRGLYKTLYSRVYGKEENKAHYYDALVCFLTELTTKDAIPNDSEFCTALKEKNLYRKNALCKYLLCAIENQSKEKVDTEALSIEHIMPQNKNLSKSWQTMLGSNWSEIHDKYLHTLGNLTLTGYNSELGDKPFSEKKKMLSDPSAHTHITILYDDVLDKDEWNESTIKAHAERLSNEVLKLFPIEKPTTQIDFKDTSYTEYTAENPEDATYKTVNYYELLGERVVVDSFATMLRSVAEKLYEVDETVIQNMARANENFGDDFSYAFFSYDKDAVKKAKVLKEGSGIFISSGYSASSTIWFIKQLLKKYELDINEDFIYSAKTYTNIGSDVDRADIEKKWCEEKAENGDLYFDKDLCTDKLIRFTTPNMKSIIPDAPAPTSPWKTNNYWFYEITNNKGSVIINLYFYCSGLTDEMKNAMEKLAGIIGIGNLAKKYKLFFKTSQYEMLESDTEDIIHSQLESMFSEIKEFESKLLSKWS